MVRLRYHWPHLFVFLLGLSLASAAIADSSQPTDEDQRAVAERTYEYFILKDGGRYEEAYALLRDSFKAHYSFREFAAGAEQFNAMAGPVEDRSVKKVTWYDNPPNAPEPGVYVAVDFASTFQNVHRHCGYLVFYQEPSGEFMIVREEVSYMDRQTEESIREQQSQEAVEAAWAELSLFCPQ